MGFLLGMAMKYNNIRLRGDIDLKIALNASKLRRTTKNIELFKSRNTKCKQTELNTLSSARAARIQQIQQDVLVSILGPDGANKYLQGDTEGLDTAKLTLVQTQISQKTAEYDAYIASKKSDIEARYELENQMEYLALKDEEEQLEQEKTQLEAEKQIADKEKELAESMSKSGLDSLFPKYGS